MSKVDKGVKKNRDVKKNGKTDFGKNTKTIITIYGLLMDANLKGRFWRWAQPLLTIVAQETVVEFTEEKAMNLAGRMQATYDLAKKYGNIVEIAMQYGNPQKKDKVTKKELETISKNESERMEIIQTVLLLVGQAQNKTRKEYLQKKGYVGKDWVFTDLIIEKKIKKK